MFIKRGGHLFLILVLAFTASYCFAQKIKVAGAVRAEESGEKLYAQVFLEGTSFQVLTDSTGKYELKGIAPGKFKLHATSYGFHEAVKEIHVHHSDITADILLKHEVLLMDSVVVNSSTTRSFGITRLKDTEGTAVYAGKKSEVILLKELTVNTSTNNTRQIFSKVAGLNIWENDGAGIQLSIGGRGLSPNRTSNFNTRQNGYDISADALGYPESYYSPATEAVERIEVVRGAASLQYGTQFGGFVNFQIKKGPEDKKIQLLSRMTYGSFNFFNSFTSIGGKIGKVNYYSFYQYKKGNGWRPNGDFNVQQCYFSADYKVTEKLTLTLQYTYMGYLAHQPGGLTDYQFKDNPRQSNRGRNWFKVKWNLGAAIVNYKISDNIIFNSRFFGLIADRTALGILTYINRSDPIKERNLWSDEFNNFGNETRLLFNYVLNKRISTFLIGTRIYYGYTFQRQGHGNNGIGGTKRDFEFIDNENTLYSQYSFPNKNYSLFIENIFKVGNKLSIVPGMRGEIISTTSNGFYTDVVLNQAGSAVQSGQLVTEIRNNRRNFVIAGIGVSYLVSDEIQYYANVSQNYRAINFNNMRILNPNVIIDPNLQDERGSTADLGMRGSLSEYFNYDVSLFNISYNNRIAPISKINQNTLQSYRIQTNVGSSRTFGMESFAELDIWRLIKKKKVPTKLTIFSNMSLMNGYYLKTVDKFIENKKVEFTPYLIFKTGLNYKFKKISCSYQFSYTAKQFTDATNAVTDPTSVNGLVPDYYIMDFSTTYNINKIFELSASINNLSNHYYFTRRAEGYPGPGIIPSDGRSFYMTLQVKLQ